MSHSAKIDRIIRESIKRVLLDEAANDSFSIYELDAIDDYSMTLRYCNSHLGLPIGEGTSRYVYQIDDETVLKVAKNDAGKEQNMVENNFCKKSFDIFPKIYDVAFDGKWMISECVLPAKNEDFIHCFDLDFDEFKLFITRCYELWGRFNCKGTPLMPMIQFKKIVRESGNLRQFAQYIKYFGHSSGDLLKINNYGMALRDGKPWIVILDSGMSHMVWTRYYNKK